MSGGYKGRRRKAWPVLAALVVVLGAAAALYFTGALGSLFPPRGNDDPPAIDPGQTNAENTENTLPADNTEHTENTLPADNTEHTENTQPTQNTENTEPVEPVDPVEPEPYARIEVPAGADQVRYDAVYRVGDTGYEMYTYVPSVGEKYAGAVTAAADELKGVADVYAVTVPLSSGVTLPDDLQGGIFDDQHAAEESVRALMDENVKWVGLYDTLMRHRTEYIYFRTDHHWSGLGAYYGYREFCRVKGIEPRELADIRTEDFPGYLGSFYYDAGEVPELGANPDVVTAYYPDAQVTMTVTDQQDRTATYDTVICDESTAPAAYKYGAYIYGDNPFTVITNAALDDGSACVVVKESFGNAFVPFLADHYQTVYVIDYRYWGGDLTDFVREKGARDLLFVNNLSALRNNYLMGRLLGMV